LSLIFVKKYTAFLSVNLWLKSACNIIMIRTYLKLKEYEDGGA